MRMFIRCAPALAAYLLAIAGRQLGIALALSLAQPGWEPLFNGGHLVASVALGGLQYWLNRGREPWLWRQVAEASRPALSRLVFLLSLALLAAGVAGVFYPVYPLSWALAWGPLHLSDWLWRLSGGSGLLSGLSLVLNNMSMPHVIHQMLLFSASFTLLRYWGRLGPAVHPTLS